MIRIAARGLSNRLAGFAGSALALALGVALVTATLLSLSAVLDRGNGPPAWYPRADAVVTGPDALPTGLPLAEPADLPPALVERISRVDGVLAAAPDRPSPVALDGQSFTARPWSVAAFGAGRLVAGREPATDGELVLPAGANVPVGASLPVRTVAGSRPFTVSGIVDGPEAVVYVRDEVAASWAGGRTPALALLLAPGAEEAVRAAVGDAGLVHVGPDRAAAEPQPDSALRSLGVTLLGNAAAVATLAAGFVVAGTFSYSVAQRRRELALLRACGATPRQVRRMVRAEALLLGVTATAAGCALGVLGAPAVADGLADAGLAPAGLAVRASPVPIVVAAAVGLVAAAAGVLAAARRAGSVGPVEAMREDPADRGTTGYGRWIASAVLGATAAGVVPLALGAGDGTASAYLLLVTITLLLAVALLAPVLVPPVLAPLGAVLRGGAARIAHANVAAGLRRTASTAAPVLLTLGLAAATLASTATLSATTAAAARERVLAPVVVEATGPVGLDPELLAAVAGVPGVGAVEPVATAAAFADEGAPEDAHRASEIAVLHAGAGIGRALRLPVVAGSLAGLDRPGTVVLGDRFAREHGWDVGGTARLTAADGTPLRLHVTAVVAEAALGGPVAVLPLGTWPRPDTAYVAVSPGTDIAEVVRVAEAHGAVAGATADVLAAESGRDEEIDRLAVLSVIGLTLTYTAISIATTFLMSTAERRRELRALRLAGATPRQLVTMLVIEVGLVVAAAAVLAALVTGVVLALTAVAAGPGVQVVMPWATVAAVAAGCVLVAVVAAVAPVARSLRAAPLAGVGRLPD